MADLNKSEKITLKYEDDKIKIVGQNIKAVLEINSSELRKMYFGNKGSGTLHLQVIGGAV